MTYSCLSEWECSKDNGISSSLFDSILRQQQSSDKSLTPAEQSEGLSTSVKQVTVS